MKALVTGSNGFVGRHMLQRLLKDGWHVTGWDDLSSGLPMHEWPSSQKPPDIFVRHDMRQPVYPLSADNFDLVVHCAAVVGGRLKIEGDPLAVATDLAIDSNLFQWIVRAEKKPKLIYFSSSAVYPVWRQDRRFHAPLYERLIRFEGTGLPMPDMTYGFAKLTGEYLAQHAAQTYGLNVVIYRPFSGYGFDQSFDYPFPSIIRRAVRRESPFTIWGSGDQARDFIHIDDVVDGVFTTRNWLKPGEALNLGTGIPTTFKQLATLACETVNYHPPLVVSDSDKPEGVFYRVADVTKLHTRFIPKISLEDGVAECVEWIARVDREGARA